MSSVAKVLESFSVASSSPHRSKKSRSDSARDEPELKSTAGPLPGELAPSVEIAKRR